MAFETFENAVELFREMLSQQSWSTDLRWLVRSRCRYSKRGLYVYKPRELTDSAPHKRRFGIALEQNKNIAFVAYTENDGYTLAGLETIRIDRPEIYGNESGSLNFKTLQTKIDLRPVESAVRWKFVKTFVPNNHPVWDHLGWPA